MYHQDFYPWVEEEEIEAMHHDCAADAVFAIMEHLYDSDNSINAEAITKHFAYLCEQLNISKDLLKEGLCVVHYKEKNPDRSAEIVESMRAPARVLKEELYNRERPVDIKRLDEAVSRICWISSQTVPYGEDITVCRSKALNPNPYNHIFG